MFVPLNHDGAKGWILNLICPGYSRSVSHEWMLLLKNATVNSNLGFYDVCKDNFVLVAYLSRPGWFDVSNITGTEEMVRRPVMPYVDLILLCVNICELFECCL